MSHLQHLQAASLSALPPPASKSAHAEGNVQASWAQGQEPSLQVQGQQCFGASGTGVTGLSLKSSISCCFSDFCCVVLYCLIL